MIFDRRLQGHQHRQPADVHLRRPALPRLLARVPSHTPTCTGERDRVELSTKRAAKLDAEAPLTLVCMNNHWQGQAVGTARQLGMLMEDTD